MKLNLILGGLLLSLLAGSVWYVDYLHDQISILKGNQIALESEVQKQNESITNYLEDQKKKSIAAK